MQSKRKRTSRRARMVSCVGALGVCWATVASAKPPVCPPGQRQGISGCRSGAPQVRLTTQPATDATRPATDASKPADGRSAPAKRSTPNVAPPPDASLRPPNSLERADRRLLIQEIARLESLVKVTHPKSPDRAQLLLRLAGAYSELAVLAEHDKTRFELQVEDMDRDKRAHPPTNRKLETETVPSHHLTL